MRGTASMLLSHGGRVAVQGVFFILLARSLGVQGFGAFSGVVALVAILQPFGSLGTVILLIMHVSRDPLSAPRQYATSLFITGVSGLVVAGVISALSGWIAPAGIGVMVAGLICGADLVGARLADVAAAVYQAQDRMLRAALYPLTIYGSRLVAAIALVSVQPHASLTAWALCYFASSVVPACALVLLTNHEVGYARPDFRGYRGEAFLGMQFAIGLTAQSIYNDIDKAMLARLGSLAAAGFYAAAYRVVDMAFVPMRALLAASYARFFQHGMRGLGATVQFTRRIAVPGVGYCCCVAAVLFAAAPVVPVVLGQSFEGAVPVLRWLAILPVLKACHYLAADALTGASMQGARTALQAAVAVANVGLNFWLIPAYSWHGAVYASLLSDGGLALALWLTVTWRLREARRVSGIGALDAS